MNNAKIPHYNTNLIINIISDLTIIMMIIMRNNIMIITITNDQNVILIRISNSNNTNTVQWSFRTIVVIVIST